MGEAKRRGTREERVAQAKERLRAMPNYLPSVPIMAEGTHITSTIGSPKNALRSRKETRALLR